MTVDMQDINRLLSVGGSVSKEARAGWSINSMELAKAREFLELQGNIKIRFTSGQMTRGTHSLVTEVDESWFHIITLSQIWPATETNYWLWHELAHAWQSEKWAVVTGKHPKDFNAAYKRAGPYATNKWEVHANQVAEQQKGWMLLDGKS